MISIIVPTYNELRTLPELLSHILALPFEKELIVVDDFSTDETRPYLVDAFNNTPDVRIVLHSKNYGKGGAILSGLLYARGDIVAIMDADLEYNPDDLKYAVSLIKDGLADVIYGSRFKNGKVGMSLSHRLANRFLTGLTNLLTGLELTDMETGCKVFRKEAIQSIHLEQLRFGFEPEVTIKLAKGGYIIREIPIRYKPRGKKNGKHIRFKDGVEAVQCIFKYA